MRSPLELTFGALWGALGPLLGGSWPSLGRSWALLGPSWDALGRSWEPLGTLLARFRDLQGSILGSPELLQEVSEQPKRRKFRKSAASCPGTVQDDSENQIHQRCTVSALLLLYRQEAMGRRSSRSELNNIVI